MKNRQICKTLFTVMIILIILSNCYNIVYAAPTEKKALRVGYMDYHGFVDRNTDDTYSGYCVDYLNEIAKYTDFQYEYVYGEWADLLQMLKNKEIDLICSAQYTEERAEIYDFSSYPIGYSQGLLYTRKGNHQFCYEDFTAFDDINVGALRGNAMTALFDSYAKQHGFRYKLKEYDTEDMLVDAMKCGEVDAICSEHLANHTDLSLLGRFGADAYYVISYKNSPYMKDINFALQKIKTDVDFETNLFHKYYDDSTAASTVQFTQEESQYISARNTIVVGLMDNRSPLSDRDKNGDAVGMIPDLMNIISEKSGLKFEYRFMKRGQKGYDFLSSSEGELVAGISSSAFSKLNPALLQSDSLQSASVVFVGRTGTQFDVNGELTVALPAGFINGEQAVAEQYPSFKYYYGTTNEDCLKAIREGKADVMLQNIYVIRECLQSPLYDGLEIFPTLSFQEEEKIVALPENVVLMSIINKSIRLITEEQANDIVISNTIGKSYHARIGEIIYRYRLPLMGMAVLFLTIVGMLIAFSVARQHSYMAIETVNRKLGETNLQLKEAVLRADRASTAKSQFLSRMSHEIRTPMNAIVGLTEIAGLHKEEPEKIEDYLGKIAISSKVLLNIINDVLDMSAIESNKLKIANAEFDIKQVLSSISTIYYPQCESKGIRFEMAADVENEYLIGDSLRVNQILLNLVSNAYKFTPKGGTIRIYVKETGHKDMTVFLKFVVSDTGCGMTEDMKARLFQPFEQETADTAKKHGGSGLGLSIAKNLVDLLHGVINVESEKEKGTTFTVDIPFEIVEHQVKKNDDNLKNVHILLADDDKVTLEYTSIVLRRIGVEFDAVNSGIEAILAVHDACQSGHPYELCLIDGKMKDVDGIEVIHRIRESEEKRTTIIIVSAYDLNEVQDKAKLAGADYFVSKPLFQSTIYNTLMRLTDGELQKKSTKSEKYDFTGHRVLLAEDQELNAMIAIELLRSVNMTVEHAEDGKSAVEMFTASVPGTYDAILMDIQMPNMDGYEATTVIRNLDRTDAKTIPIYAMTADAFTEDIATAISVGMNGHIAKPIDTKILYQILQEVIGADIHK